MWKATCTDFYIPVGQYMIKYCKKKAKNICLEMSTRMILKEIPRSFAQGEFSGRKRNRKKSLNLK